MGLQAGEALLGDYKKCGFTEQEYRSAKERLAKYGFVTFKATYKGTIAKLADTRVYDVNIKGEQHTEQRTSNGLTTTNKKGKKDKNNNIRQNSDEFRLSELLLNLIIERKPDFKKPNCEQWAKHVDRMLRIDKRTPAAIEAVIRWCQGDNGDGRWSGWQNNILSTAKLRLHFDKLELAMGKARAKMGERAEIPEQKKTEGYLQTLEAHKKASQQHLQEIENATAT